MKSKLKVIFVIPARNEEKFLGKTIASLRKQDAEIKVIVVNDGSTDKTGQISERDADLTIFRKDRGFSALGKKNLLVHTFNSGFDNIDNVMPDFDYLGVIGAGDILPPYYFSTITERMKKKNISIASGVIRDEKNVINVRGSGRIIERKFWKKFGSRYPNNPVWEDYIIYFAPAYGYRTKIFSDIYISALRKTSTNYPSNMYYRGVSANTFEYPLLYAFAKGLRYFLKSRKIKSLTTFMQGYRSERIEIDTKVVRYLKEIMAYRLKKQISFIFKKFI